MNKKEPIGFIGFSATFKSCNSCIWLDSGNWGQYVAGVYQGGICGDFGSLGTLHNQGCRVEVDNAKP